MSPRLLAALLVLAACSPERGRPAAVQQGVVNGTPDTTPSHAAVVAVRIQVGAGHGLCSGTLIADRIVLTAAHCLAVNPDPAGYQVGFGSDVTGAMSWVAVEALRAHPGYSHAGDADDLGLLRLSASAPAGVEPIPPLPPSLALGAGDVGLAAEVAGFGDDAARKSGVKLHLPMTIAAVCTDQPCLVSSGLCTANAIGFAQQSGGACSGDSGGPVFVRRKGVEYVAGVNSYGDENCLAYGCATKVDAFARFLEIFQARAERPQGAACSDAVECASGFCVDGVCCDRRCHLAPCEACATKAGAPSDGTCAFTSTPCDDGLGCTLDDACRQGVCKGVAMVCSAPDSCHEASSCNPATGSCRAFAQKADGTACDDGLGCTVGDICRSGTCSGRQKDCVAPDVCHLAVCDSGSGECVVSPAPDGLLCDDHDPCTLDDACRSGTCRGSPLVCVAAGECRVAGACNASSGTCSDPPAADGVACGAGSCQSGACVAPAPAKKSGCSAAPGDAWVGLGVMLYTGVLRRRRAISRTPGR